MQVDIIQLLTSIMLSHIMIDYGRTDFNPFTGFISSAHAIHKKYNPGLSNIRGPDPTNKGLQCDLRNYFSANLNVAMFFSPILAGI